MVDEEALREIHRVRSLSGMRNAVAASSTLAGSSRQCLPLQSLNLHSDNRNTGIIRLYPFTGSERVYEPNPHHEGVPKCR